MVDYVNAAIYQKIAVEIRSVCIVNQFVKPIYLRKGLKINMPKICSRLKNILATLNIQRTKDILIRLCHKIGNNSILHTAPGAKIYAGKFEYLKWRYRQTDF